MCRCNRAGKKRIGEPNGCGKKFRYSPLDKKRMRLIVSLSLLVSIDASRVGAQELVATLPFKEPKIEDVQMAVWGDTILLTYVAMPLGGPRTFRSALIKPDGSISN